MSCKKITQKHQARFFDMNPYQNPKMWVMMKQGSLFDVRPKFMDYDDVKYFIKLLTGQTVSGYEVYNYVRVEPGNVSFAFCT